jgi:hypothetical protein
MPSSNYCEIGRDKGVSGCARGEEEDWKRGRVFGLTKGVGIGRRRLQTRRTPTRKSAQPGGVLMRLMEGDWRGHRGGFIAALAWRGG